VGQGGRISPNRLSFAGYPITKREGYARFLVERELNQGKTDRGVRVVLETGTILAGEEIPIRIDVGHPGFPGGEPWPG
jgi:hypothetical protein